MFTICLEDFKEDDDEEHVSSEGEKNDVDGGDENDDARVSGAESRVTSADAEELKRDSGNYSIVGGTLRRSGRFNTIKKNFTSVFQSFSYDRHERTSCNSVSSVQSPRASSRLSEMVFGVYHMYLMYLFNARVK